MRTALNFPGYSLITKACVTSDTCKAQNFGLFSWGFYIGCCTSDGKLDLAYMILFYFRLN